MRTVSGQIQAVWIHTSIEVVPEVPVVFSRWSEIFPALTDPEHTELLRIVMTAGRANHLLNGMQTPVDPVFDTEQSATQV